jgi:membrane-bound serine protease (ClpP class)
VGAVCLALSAYGLGVLPVNWFGLVFLAIAFVLFVLDIKAPTHGALTAAGVGSLIVAGLVLFNSPGTPDFTHVSVPFVVTLSVLTAAFFFVILSIGIRAQKVPVRTGSEGLVGRSGVARSDLNPSGSVQVASELWSAEIEDGAQPLTKGTHVKVTRVDGIKLQVRKEEE